MLGPPLLDMPAGNGPNPSRTDQLVGGWWSSVVSGKGTVLPDGSVDVLWVPGRLPVLAGPDVVPRPVELPGSTTVVGVRLQPGVASEVLGDGANRAVGHQVPLAEVWSRVELDRLQDDLGRIEEVVEDGVVGEGAAAMALARAIDRRVASEWRPDPVVLDAVSVIADGTEIEAREIGARQLRRRFTAAVGYGPALFRRIKRLDRFSDRLAAEPDRSLADLAAAAGFYDQAHLVRDCRQLLGMTPSEFRLGR